MELTDLADFNIVALHGGFGRAARATGRSKTSLSRHVANLEAELGVRLLERGVRDPKLTQEGRALHERTSALLSDIAEVGIALAMGADQHRGRLRISVPVMFGQAAMGRLTAEYSRRHPDVRIEVCAEDRSIDPIEDGYDLVVRVNPAPDEKLIGRRFLRDKLVVVASPDLREMRTGPSVRAVTLRPGAQQIWRLIVGGGERRIEADAILCLSSWTMVRDAVRAKAGAAVLPMSVVRDDLVNGELELWGELLDGAVELWVLYPTRRLLNRRVSTFMEFIVSAYSEEQLSLLPSLAQEDPKA